MSRVMHFLIVSCAVAVVVSTVRADNRVTRRDAETFKQKVAIITQAGESPHRQPLRTTVTENELNAYLAFGVGTDLPPGVVEPVVSILGTGRLSARAVVDMDAVKKQKNASSLLDPMTYMTGRVPLTATGTLTTRQGMGRFDLESATVAGVPVPKMMLQQILSYYSRTPANANGITLDDPFPLPARIKEIQVLPGQAVIVQ